MAKVAVIGIGNPFRGDDGAGWAVIDALEGKVPCQIKLGKTRGEITEILSFFEDYSVLYLVDACLGSKEAGSWQRLDALKDNLYFENTQTSTHGLSIAQAISLAKTWEQLPTKLIVYAIFGERFAVERSLSAKVGKAVPKVTESILQEEEIRHA